MNIWRRWLGSWKTFERFLIVIGAVIGFGTLVATCRSVAAQRRATEVDKRAWMVTTEYDLLDEPVDHKRVSAQVKVINAGETPAYDVAIRGLLEISKDQPSMTKSESDSYPQTNRAFVVFQGESAGLLIRLWTNGDLPVGTTEFYAKGDLKLWAYGLITYTDAFNRPHWLTFCRMHAFGETPKMFHPCDPPGNNTDRETNWWFDKFF